MVSSATCSSDYFFNIFLKLFLLIDIPSINEGIFIKILYVHNHVYVKVEMWITPNV